MKAMLSMKSIDEPVVSMIASICPNLVARRGLATAEKPIRMLESARIGPLTLSPTANL